MTAKGPLGLPPDQKGGVFFLFGDDEFRKEEAARALVEWHLESGARDFNFDPLRGSEVDVETLASVLGTPPMMAEWRVVILREAEALAPSPRARDVVLEVAAKPPPGLAFILVASIPARSRAKFYQELKRKTRSVEFREVASNDVPGWLMEWASSRHNRAMEPEAAQALGSALGTDLGVLAQEVDKLSSLTPEGEPITVETVRKAGTRIPAEDRWEWLDRVARKEFKDALRGLEILVSQGETGVGLTIGLATHFLRLGVACEGGRKALDELLEPRQRWLAKKLLPQSRKWTGEEIREALDGLRRVDQVLKSKSGHLADESVLEEWLLGLMAREEGVEGKGVAS